MMLVLSALAMSAIAAPGNLGAADTSSLEPIAQANSAPSLDEFLDSVGHLRLPAGFSGSLNPDGYQLVSSEGEALRFAPKAAKRGGADDLGWTGFGGIGTGCNGDVWAVAIGGEGEVYVGGDFSLCGDLPANNVARFDSTTQAWTSLGSGTTNGVNYTVRALAMAGTELFVGGWFTQAGGAAARYIARFDTTTQTWASLNSGVTNGLGVFGSVYALAVIDSSLYVGGSFTDAAGVGANNIARFDTTTQTWASLGSGGSSGLSGSVFSLAASGSDLYAGGDFLQAGGVMATRVARFDTLSQTWTSLGTGVTNGLDGRVTGLAVSGSDVYVGGFFTQAGGAMANRVARFDTISQTWASLGSNGTNGVIGQVFGIALSGSDLYVGGSFSQASGAAANRVARFDITSQTWSGLGSGAANGVAGSVFALAISGSNLYVGGTISQAGGATANRVARFDTVNQAWRNLGSGVATALNGQVFALAVSGSSLYLGGSFSHAAGLVANNIARFDTASRTWASLGSGATKGVEGIVSALAVSGRDLYVGGSFNKAGGMVANRVARFDTITQDWFRLGTVAANGVDARVNAFALSGSTLYVGGSFNRAGDALANRVARFDTTTQTWAGSLGSGSANGVNNVVSALAVSGSDVYVGGSFSQAGGTFVSRVARFNTNSQTWSSLNDGGANGVNGTVLALAVSGNDVYIGGEFSQAGFVDGKNIIRFNTQTQTWARLGSFGSDGVNGPVLALAVYDGDVYAGGGFTQAGAVLSSNVARFNTTNQTWASLGIGVDNGVNSGVNSGVYALAQFNDGALYVGGSFGSAGGQASSGIARYGLRPVFFNGFE